MDIIFRDREYSMDDYFRMNMINKRMDEALFEYLLTSNLARITVINRRGYGYSFMEVTLTIKSVKKAWNIDYLSICEAIEAICRIEPSWMDTDYNYILTGESKRIAIKIN